MVATPIVAFAWLLMTAVPTGSNAESHWLQDLIASFGTTFQESSAQEGQKPKPTKVVGTVKDSGGTPVAKAQVKIEKVEASTEFATVDTWTTSPEGTFEFTGPDGRYRITIKSADKELKTEATIGGGRLEPNEFTLR